MNYAIVTVSNGHFKIEAEGYTEVDKAKVRYHGVCQALWNAADVETAEVMIADENLNCVEGYKEFINHREPEDE